MKKVNRIKEFLNRKILYHEVIPKNLVGCEIGVCSGDNAVQLYFASKPSKLFLVDLWKKNSNPNPRHGTEYFLDDHFDLVNNRFKEEIKNGIVEMYRSGSHVFLSSLEDNSLDWVYLDSDHRYDHVFHEISLSINKVKPGGLIMGHDFQFHERWGLGVVRPVLEFCNSGNIEMVAISDEEFSTWVCVNKK